MKLLGIISVDFDYWSDIRHSSDNGEEMGV
jgi:hypothetical protein